ncbi:fructose-bisphosphate aldolase [Pseudomonas sp. S3E12]|uniref:fructose-bisphosphate aldolase n=1 Tax=Pseudomonas sp. S3E12 TaxID=1873126 RepID=UPI00081BD1F6|nr:fructose-bisphosphate aldolase [Pseudomonas sp. S3E12]OCW27377.1 fructose-bisphosphate aldolase [Pseudomonas sp. S3E12]
MGDLRACRVPRILGLRTRTQLPPRHFTPCTETATDYPVLLIDSDLHACLRERLNAALEDLNLIACSSLPDFAERDLNNVANTASILVQDVSDVFHVIERRGFDTPPAG